MGVSQDPYQEIQESKNQESNNPRMEHWKLPYGRPGLASWQAELKSLEGFIGISHARRLEGSADKMCTKQQQIPQYIHYESMQASTKFTLQMLTTEFGFQVTDIRQLRDDHPQRMPTRKNITASLNWLVIGR